VGEFPQGWLRPDCVQRAELGLGYPNPMGCCCAASDTSAPAAAVNPAAVHVFCFYFFDFGGRRGEGANAVPTVQIGADNMNHNTSSNTVCCSYIGGGEGREGGTG